MDQEGSNSQRQRTWEKIRTPRFPLQCRSSMSSTSSSLHWFPQWRQPYARIRFGPCQGLCQDVAKMLVVALITTIMSEVQERSSKLVSTTKRVFSPKSSKGGHLKIAWRTANRCWTFPLMTTMLFTAFACCFSDAHRVL